MAKTTLGGALNRLKKPESADVQPVATSGPESQPMAKSPASPPVCVVIRFNPRDHETVSDYASDLNMSIQELVEVAINEKRARQGLAAIEGRPRSKTRRRT